MASITTFYSLYNLHINAKSAFLNGNSDLELYIGSLKVSLTEIILTKSCDPTNHFMASNKCLVSGTYFFINISSILALNHVNQIQIFTSIFVYVDDILIFSINHHFCKAIFQQLSSQFKMETLEPPKIFLGLNITHTATGNISINEMRYIYWILKWFNK